jgi:DUF1365 family protein
MATLGPEGDARPGLTPAPTPAPAPAPASVLASALYIGAVRHRRFEVREHVLRYRLALAYIDLDELPHLLGGRLVDPRPGLVRFRRRDYLVGAGGTTVPLSTAVRDEVQRHAGRRPEGPIRLLTQLRSYGHCFNPVSFYYCFDARGDRLEHVLAEVTNTPWGERHPYVISATGENAPGDALTGASEKMLHVSPFMGMDHTYRWRVTPPGRTLEVHIENHRRGRRAFDASLSMRRHPLTRRLLSRTALDYPFSTLRVLALIYSHAVRLKLKGVPVHPHPSPEAS